MRPVLGAAVVGLGVGREHALAYARISRCALRCVHDLDAARARRVVEEIGQGAVAPSFEAVLADEEVDIVSIASYDDVHFTQVVAALRTGKHVFVEKPLCRTMDELRAVRQTWEASGRHLESNLVLRSAPLYRWLRRAIEGGDLGTIYAVDGDYLYGRIEKITNGWRKDVEQYSVMQGGGVHMVDLMLWLTGEMPTSVTALGSRVCTKGTAFRYNDYMAATFHFPSGLIGRITANFGCVHRHQHALRVFGTRGTFIYDDAGARLHASRDPSATVTAVELSPLPSSKGDLIPDFVGRILNGGEQLGLARHEFDVIRACLAADQAAWNEKPVTIEEL